MEYKSIKHRVSNLMSFLFYLFYYTLLCKALQYKDLGSDITILLLYFTMLYYTLSDKTILEYIENIIDIRLIIVYTLCMDIIGTILIGIIIFGMLILSDGEI